MVIVLVAMNQNTKNKCNVKKLFSINKIVGEASSLVGNVVMRVVEPILPQ